MTNPLPRRQSRILSVTQLSATGYEIQLERSDLVFRAGQEITIHGPDPTFDRTYSIASGEEDDVIRILFRLIPEGKMTPLLAGLGPGDTIDYTGAFGSFTVRDPARPILFVATGTGIAPCLGFARTYPAISLTVLHGVRTSDDLFYRDALSAYAYHPCLSRDVSSALRGRVTDLLATLPLEKDHHCYLCGSNAMITDAHRILKSRGVRDDAIFSEPYYFW